MLNEHLQFKYGQPPRTHNTHTHKYYGKLLRANGVELFP